MKKLFSFCFWVIFIVGVMGQEFLPIKTQAVLIKKIFNYTENMNELYVTVIYNEADKSVKNQLVKELEGIGVKVDALSEKLVKKADGNFVYLTPNVSNKALDDCKSLKKMIISGEKKHVKAGFASLAIIMLNHKPKILVNLLALEQSGVKVSGSLFRVAQKVN